MKKVLCIVLILIVFFFFIEIDISAKGFSEVIINYSDTDNYNEYLKRSSNFSFDNTMIKE